MLEKMLSELDPASLEAAAAAAGDELRDAYEIDDHETGRIFAKYITSGADYVDEPAYWERVKSEFKEFLCGTEKKYESDRKRIFGIFENFTDALTDQVSRQRFTQMITVVIAGAIADQMGLLWGALVGVVGLFLMTATKIGKEAYCRGTGSPPSNA